MNIFKKVANFATNTLGKLGSVAAPIVTLFNPLAGAAVGATSSALNTIGNNNQQQANFDASMAFNAQQAQLNRDFNAQQAALTRNYNSPSNQMALLKQAGLNPILTNPSMSAATPATGSAASAPGAPTLTAPTSSDYISQMSVLEDYLAKKNQRKADEKGREYTILTLDGNGNPIVDVFGINAYGARAENAVNNAAISTYGVEDAYIRNRMDVEQLDNLRYQNTLNKALKDVTIGLKGEELKQAIEKTKELIMSNEIGQSEKQLYDLYGIKSDDKNSVTTLVRLILRDPENANRVLDTLLDAVSRFGQHAFDRLDEGFDKVLSSFGTDIDSVRDLTSFTSPSQALINHVVKHLRKPRAQAKRERSK